MKLRVTVNGQSYDVDVEGMDEHRTATTAATSYQATPPVPPQAVPVSAAPSAGQRVMTSPIPGTVVEVHAHAGQTVKRNQQLMTIDAMKMNTQISAIMDGKIKEIHVRAGDAVKMGQPLVTFE